VSGTGPGEMYPFRVAKGNVLHNPREVGGAACMTICTWFVMKRKPWMRGLRAMGA
jgi:hypothetical protein